MELILSTPPDQLRQAQEYRLTIAHMAYRIGGGPHLFRSSQQLPLRGGLMALDDRGFDGRGDPAGFCREVMRECSARQFSGILCDFESRFSPALALLLEQLDDMCAKRQLTLCVPELYADRCPAARILISSALSGGSLGQRIQEAVERLGPQRVTLAVERVAMDFYLPSPSGQGEELSREALRALMEERAPSVFFSGELCAHYFTYMSRQNGAHFILYDDAASIRKKLELARRAGLSSALLAYPQVDDLLAGILA